MQPALGQAQFRVWRQPNNDASLMPFKSFCATPLQLNLSAEHAFTCCVSLLL
jgi:hypothetical protein